MYPQRHVPQRATGVLPSELESGVARVKAEAFTLARAEAFKLEHGSTYFLPGFEGFRGGSWWDVDIVEQRDKYYLAKYLPNSAGEEDDDSWLPLNHLRLRTRKSDDWDCHILKRGMDISILGMHSNLEDFVFHPQGLYDARIIQQSRVAHGMKCMCRFHVKFYCVREDEDPSLGRKLSNHSSAPREIDISNVSILQQPVNFSFEEILRSHMLERWLPKKWGNDAYFLRETKLGSGDDEDNEDDESMDTLPAHVTTRSDKPGASLSPSRGSTAVPHHIDRNPTGEGKVHAYARDRLDQKQKLDAANKVVRGLKHDGHDLESDVRASNKVLPDRFQELDVMSGAKTCRGGKRAVETDYDRGKGGLGVGGGGRAYDKSREGNEQYGVNVSERENDDERVVRVRPNYFYHDGVRSRDDNLDVEGTGKLERGDCVAVKPRHSILNVEGRANPNRTETRPELVRGVKKTGDEVLGPPKKKQKFNPCQTGRRYVSPQKERTRNRHRTQIIIDTSSEESQEDSGDLLADSLTSDESSVDSQTQRKKGTKFVRNTKDDPMTTRVTIKLSGDREKRLTRRNKHTRKRDETHVEIDRGKGDIGFQATGAEELQYSGKDPSEVKTLKSSPPKENAKSPAGHDQDLVTEGKQTGAEEALQLVRRRGRPRKPTTTTKGKASGKQEEKNSASPQDTSGKRKVASEVKDGKHLKSIAKSSSKTKARVVINLDDDNSDEIEGDIPIRREGSGTKMKERLRQKKRQENTDGDKAASNTHWSEERKAGQAEVILPVRLRSQRKKVLTTGSCLGSKQSSTKIQNGGVQRIAQGNCLPSKQSSTEVQNDDVQRIAQESYLPSKQSSIEVQNGGVQRIAQGNCLPSKQSSTEVQNDDVQRIAQESCFPLKQSSIEVQNGGVERIAQRPLYLDVLGDSPHEETQVVGGADVEEQSRKPGGDLDSDPGPTIFMCPPSISVENLALVNLPNQDTKPSEFQVSDVDRKMRSVSDIETSGEVGGSSVLMDKPGGSAP